jgi:hypothetical protein
MVVNGKPPAGGWKPVFTNPYTKVSLVPGLEAKVESKFDWLHFRKGALPYFELYEDACNIGVNSIAGGGVVRYLKVSIAYRKPYCTLPSYLPPQQPENTPIEIPEDNCSRSDTFYITVPTEMMDYREDFRNGNYKVRVSYKKLTLDLIEVDRNPPPGLRSANGSAVLVFLKFRATGSSYISRDWLLNAGGAAALLVPAGAGVNYVYREEETMEITYAIVYGNSHSLVIWSPLGKEFIEKYSHEYLRLYIPMNVFNSRDYLISFLQQRAGNQNISGGNRNNYFLSDLRMTPDQKPAEAAIVTPYKTAVLTSTGTFLGVFGDVYYKYEGTEESSHKVKHNVFLVCLDYKKIDPPPPPPKKKCCNDMNCCPDNADLLKLLLAKVKKLSEIVGVDEYPASVPISMITKEGKHSDNKNISNLTQLFGWYVERFDELIGQFEIDIEIKDTDLTKEGEQSTTVRLPNIAESIAEMTALLIKASINSELLINICNRTLIEAGQDKQQNFKNYMASLAIIDYLGFAYADAEEKMPLTFTPGETSFDKMLKEAQVPLQVIRYNQKGGLRSQINDLLQAAAIIRAVFWRKIDPKSDIDEQFKQIIMNAKDTKDKLNKTDFEQLIKDLEPEQE